MFYTLTKIHKPTLVGKPIISGCDGLTKRLSSFPSGVDKVLQPIAQIQESYLKDTTHFIRFIESTRVPKNAFLVSMNVTSMYMNIPQEEGITIVCNAYENVYSVNKPLPWKRFIYEVFCLWVINKEEIFEQANSYHPTIKFTAEVSQLETTRKNRFSTCAHITNLLKHFSTQTTTVATQQALKKASLKKKLLGS